ncbi:MAG: hypothetical protein ACERKT_08615 [Acidobacteriota bacterium]|jgi:hypothetical protein
MAFEGFKKGQKIWIHNADGSARPGIFVGEGENATFFGGPPLCYVVTEDTKESGEVQLDRVTARDD